MITSIRLLGVLAICVGVGLAIMTSVVLIANFQSGAYTLVVVGAACLAVQAACLGWLVNMVVRR